MECMTIHQLQQVMSQDDHLQHFKYHIIQDWPKSRDQIPQDMRTYWMFQDDMALIDGIILKGWHIVIPEALQRQMLQQLHINHIGIEKKTKLLAHESMYWIGMNLDVKNYIKYSTCLDFSKHS